MAKWICLIFLIFLVTCNEAGVVKKSAAPLSVIDTILKDDNICGTLTNIFSSHYFNNCSKLSYPITPLDLTTDNADLFYCLALYDRSFQICRSTIKLQTKQSLLKSKALFDSEMDNIIKYDKMENILDICKSQLNSPYPFLYNKTNSYVAQLMEPGKCIKSCYYTTKSGLNPLCVAIHIIDREILRGDESQVVTKLLANKKKFDSSVINTIINDKEICPSSNELLNSVYFNKCRELPYPTGPFQWTRKSSDLLLCLAIYDRAFKICHSTSLLLTNESNVLTDKNLFDKAMNNAIENSRPRDLLTICDSIKESFHLSYYKKTHQFTIQLENPTICVNSCYHEESKTLNHLCLAIHLINEQLLLLNKTSIPAAKVEHKQPEKIVNSQREEDGKKVSIATGDSTLKVDNTSGKLNEPMQIIFDSLIEKQLIVSGQNEHKTKENTVPTNYQGLDLSQIKDDTNIVENDMENEYEQIHATKDATINIQVWADGIPMELESWTEEIDTATTEEIMTEKDSFLKTYDTMLSFLCMSIILGFFIVFYRYVILLRREESYKRLNPMSGSPNIIVYPHKN